MSHEDELTQAEREALARLPRELDPPRALEERTVRALRAEGSLTHARWSRRSGPRFLMAAAAAVLLYLGGVVTGQWLTTRQTVNALNRMQRDNAMQAAALVQRTGTAYAEAIAALSRLPASSDSQYVRQGREVALTALYAAANEMIRLSPDDPAVMRMVQVLEHEREPSDSARTSEPRRVVWF